MKYYRMLKRIRKMPNVLATFEYTEHDGKRFRSIHCTYKQAHMLRQIVEWVISR